MGKDLKSLKVFSKKTNEFIDVLNINKKLATGSIEMAWMDGGWSNAYGVNWLDNGWANMYGVNWMDNGWNNWYGPSWTDNGWNNFRGDSWSDGGWNNSRGVWNNSYGSSSSGTQEGCFITTAAVEHMGLDDNCDELNILRKYRDQLVEKDPEFRKIVLEYYKVAPHIVAKINNNDNKDQILDNIYKDLVVPVTNYLKKGKVDKAKEHYINTYNKLKEEYNC